MILPRTMLSGPRHREFLRRTGRCVILLLLIAFLPVACSRKASDRGQTPPASLIKLREGDYLTDGYIADLRKTRSPLSAGSHHRLDLVIVKKDGNNFNLAPIFNFHEGGETFVLHPDASVTTTDPDPAYFSNLTVSVKNEDSFQLGFEAGKDSFKSANFVFVKDAVTYVAKAILAGSYKDDHGLRYEFRDDGLAIFPNRRFKFEIGVDHVGTQFDYFMEMKPNGTASSVTAFKWTAGTLQLFRTKEDENGFDEITDRRPYKSLQPIR